MAEAIDIRELNIRIEQQSQFVTNLVMGMNKVIVGQKHLVDCLLIGLLSDGHILLEGVPGLAKTLAIKTLSQLISSTIAAFSLLLICCLPMWWYSDLFTERRGFPCKARSCLRQFSFWQMRLTVLQPRCRVRCSKPCRNIRLPLAMKPSNCLVRSW